MSGEILFKQWDGANCECRFHVTTAYDILRMKGVDLEKLDFLNGAGMIEILDMSKEN